MVRRSLKLLISALTVLMLGCSLTTHPDIEPIGAALIINSVKCGLALALEKEQKKGTQKRLAGNIATLELEMKVTTNKSGSLSGVIPFKSVPNIVPTFSGSKSGSWTAISTINAVYLLDATNDTVCDAAHVNEISRAKSLHGFSDWLGKILDDLSRVSLEKPSGTLVSLKYETAFGVEKGASLQLAFYTSNLSLANTRSDLQTLKVVISSAKALEKSAPGVGTGGVGPLSVKDTQRFSRVAPAEG